MNTTLIFRRYLPLLLVSASLGVNSCNSDNVVPAPVVDVRVDGVVNVEVQKNGTAVVPLSVTSVNGQPSTALSVAGLPPGVTGTFNPASGTPNFTTLLTFMASSSSVAGATSTAAVSANPASGSMKAYSFTVTVNPSCEMDVAGTYNVSETCTIGPPDSYQCIVTPDPAVSTARIQFSNFLNSGFTVFADLDCTAGALVIPPQPLTSGDISGSGTFAGNTLSVNSTVTDINGSVAFSCASTFNR